MFRRMVRAALFNAGVYRELRDDPTATLQAFAVILLGSITLILVLVLGPLRSHGIGAYIVVFTSVLSSGIVGWFLVSLLFYVVGGRLLRRKITLPSLLRTTGFANAPAVLYIFAPVAGGDALILIFFGILLWTLFAMAVALQQALSIPFAGGLWLAIPGILLMLIIQNLFVRSLLSEFYGV